MQTGSSIKIVSFACTHSFNKLMYLCACLPALHLHVVFRFAQLPYYSYPTLRMHGTVLGSCDCPGLLLGSCAPTLPTSRAHVKCSLAREVDLAMSL